MLRPLSVRTRLTLWYSALLLATLAGMGALSYEILAWSLLRDTDAAILGVAEVIRATGQGRTGLLRDPAAEGALRDALGSRLLDTFFQLVEPGGQPSRRSPRLTRPLPLSAEARRAARRGRETFESVTLDGGERLRVVTLPARRDGHPAELIQVGMSLGRLQETLRRYLQILLALVPLGVGLAAAGGAGIARIALRPVHDMARRAREITAEDLARRVPGRGAGDELDYLAETLNAMLARLEAAFAELRRFTADAAHELRTPLTALKGGLEVALRHPRSADEYARTLRESLEEVDRLVRLAEDLLLLSRAAAGAGLARRPVEVEPLVLDALDTGLRLARGTGISVRLGAVEPALVVGDAGALRRVLVNLVENAVKYTPPGGVVELGLRREGPPPAPAGPPPAAPAAAPAAGWVAVEVRDSGIGIDPADAGRIFERFVRLDEARSRETGGAGLGLAIARSIARAHGGDITVESALKAGTLFTLRLPEGAGPPAPPPPAPPAA
jgi:signal transduction histidine kinase